MKRLREKIVFYKNKIKENPKRVYRFGMIVLSLSVVFHAVEYFVFPVKKVSIVSVPTFNTSNNPNPTLAKSEKTTNEIAVVVKELQQLKVKEENGLLTANDSVRIEYLFNKYQNLKNELKEN